MAHSALTLDTWFTNTMTRPGCVSRNLYRVTSFWPCAHSALYLPWGVTWPQAAGVQWLMPNAHAVANALREALHHHVFACKVKNKRRCGQVQRRDEPDERHSVNEARDTASKRHLSKLELLDSSSVIAMPSPLAIVPFAPLLNKRV